MKALLIFILTLAVLFFTPTLSKGQTTIHSVTINFAPAAEPIIDGDTLYTATVAIALSDTADFSEIRVKVTRLDNGQALFDSTYSLSALPQSQNAIAWKSGMTIYAVTINKSVFHSYRYEVKLLDVTGNVVATNSTDQ